MNTRKLYYLFTVLTFLLVFTACGEDDLIDTIQTFEKSFTIGTSSQLTDIIINDDNSYLTVGTAEINGISALVLMKVSPAGDTLWTRKYQNQEGYSIIKTQDGNYAISGVSKVTSSNTLGLTVVTKVDSQGNTLWSTKLSQSNELFSGNGNIAEAADGSLWVLTNPNAITQSHFVIDIIGSDGVKKQTKEMPGVYAADIKPTSDGAFVIASNTTGPWISLTKVDLTGNVIWSTTNGFDHYNWAQSIVLMADGGFAVTGSSFNPKSRPSIIFFKIDKNGERVELTGFRAQSFSYGNMIDVRNNNGFFIAAHGMEEGYNWSTYAYTQPDEAELIALSVSSSGELQHTKNFGKAGHFLFIKETSDGGVILGGKRNGHIFLTKTKPNFEL